MAYDPVFKFGTYSEASIQANVIIDGAVVTKTFSAAELITAAENLDPLNVLVALNSAGNTLKYEFGANEYTEAQLQTMVDNGRVTVTSGGNLMLDGTEIDNANVGTEIQTKVIDMLQNDISDLNDLVSRLGILDNWLQSESDIEDKGEHTFEPNKDSGGYYDAMKAADPSLNNYTVDWVIRDANNDYLKWMEISASDSSDKDATYRWSAVKMTSDAQHIKMQTNDFTNAMEQIRNLVKEKSTQAEQLSTEFQTRNSSFNSLIEAMSSYTKVYNEASKTLLTG